MLKGWPCLTFIIPSPLRHEDLSLCLSSLISDLRMPRIFIGDPKIEEAGSLRKSFELVKLVTIKHLDLLRSSVRCYPMFKGQSKDGPDREKVKYLQVKDVEDYQQGIYDKPLPCFGCGVGWFSFLLGFFLPLMWYYATFLYFGNYYRKDPRERAGLAASAIAALAFSVVLLMIIAVLLLQSS